MQARSRLLPLLRSALVGDLLAWLYLHPEESYSQSELAGRLSVTQSAVSREADRLVSAGLISEERRGNMRLLRADLTTSLARPLAELLALTYGPLAVLSTELARVDGIDEAYIYGSWAARYRGEPGPPPRDIDVILVGDADEDDVFDAARIAERQLGREVNIHRVSLARWRNPGDDPFLASVRARPLVQIEL
jgi:DNA-binding MarR family transcriptional regulator